VQTWNYDDAGNWDSTAKTIGSSTTNEARTHSVADHISTIAGNAATHDLKGNLTAYEINAKDYTVTYDLDNRMTKVEVDNDDVEYRYDAFGRRVIRQEGSTKSALIWGGNSECAEHKHQAGQTVIQNDIMEHPSRLNSVIARAVDGSKFELQWYHKNYLDHVYVVSDDDGDPIEHYRYSAFGEVTIYDESGNLENTTQIDNHILWNTRRRDEVSGYYMYKYRHYSPELGRWPSRDPIEESGGINLYAFVGNDPIGRWDRLGLLECDNTGHKGNRKFKLIKIGVTKRDAFGDPDDVIDAMGDTFDGISDVLVAALGTKLPNDVFGTAFGDSLDDLIEDGVDRLQEFMRGLMDKLGKAGAGGGMIIVKYQCLTCICTDKKHYLNPFDWFKDGDIYGWDDPNEDYKSFVSERDSGKLEEYRNGRPMHTLWEGKKDLMQADFFVQALETAIADCEGN